MRPAPVAAPVAADWPFDDLFDGADDFLGAPLQIPSGYVTLDDDWGDD